MREYLAEDRLSFPNPEPDTLVSDRTDTSRSRNFSFEGHPIQSVSNANKTEEHTEELVRCGHLPFCSIHSPEKIQGVGEGLLVQAMPEPAELKAVKVRKDEDNLSQGGDNKPTQNRELDWLKGLAVAALGVWGANKIIRRYLGGEAESTEIVSPQREKERSKPSPSNAGKLETLRDNKDKPLIDLPGLNRGPAPGLAVGDRVQQGGEIWTAKGQYDGKLMIYQKGRGLNFAGEFRIIEDSKSIPNHFKEIPKFDGQQNDVRYYSDTHGRVYKVAEMSNGKTLIATAHDLRLVSPEEIDAFTPAGKTSRKPVAADTKKENGDIKAAPPLETAKPSGVSEVLGKPGPGVTPQMVTELQRLANSTGETLIVFGSRQTGISEKSGKPFSPESDLDLAAINKDSLLRFYEIEGGTERWQKEKVTALKHAPMCIISAEEALKKGYLVILPKANVPAKDLPPGPMEIEAKRGLELAKDMIAKQPERKISKTSDLLQLLKSCLDVIDELPPDKQFSVEDRAKFQKLIKDYAEAVNGKADPKLMNSVHASLAVDIQESIAQTGSKELHAQQKSPSAGSEESLPIKELRRSAESAAGRTALVAELLEQGPIRDTLMKKNADLSLAEATDLEQKLLSQKTAEREHAEAKISERYARRGGLTTFSKDLAKELNSRKGAMVIVAAAVLPWLRDE